MRSVCTCVHYSHIQVSVSGVEKYTKLDSGVYIYDVEEGSGASPRENDQVKRERETGTNTSSLTHVMQCKHTLREGWIAIGRLMRKCVCVCVCTCVDLQVTFHYTAYNENGRKIDSSYNRNKPVKVRSFMCDHIVS